MRPDSPTTVLEPAAGPRFVDPRVLAKIGSLELLAKVVVEGFINGLHRSPHLGLSTDFAEHRQYMPGDDLRRVDWRLYGRTDRYYLKEFEADTNTTVGVLLDISRSMNYASAGITKLDYGRYLAACLLYFSRQQRDRVAFATFDDAVVDVVPPSARHLPAALHAIERIKPGRQGALRAPLRTLARHFQRRSILVVISDLYDEPRAVLDAVTELRNRGNEIIVMHLLDPAELDFPFDEAASFQDMESDDRIPVVPGMLRDQYRALIRAHTAELSRLLGDNRIDYLLLDTSRPLEHALFDYLSERQQLSRVR